MLLIKTPDYSFILHFAKYNPGLHEHRLRALSTADPFKTWQQLLQQMLIKVEQQMKLHGLH